MFPQRLCHLQDIVSAAMASLSYLVCPTIRCSATNNSNEPNKLGIKSVKVKGLLSFSAVNCVATISVAAVENTYVAKPQIRQNIPTRKQLVDPFRQGLIILDGVGYRQTVVIRSYEVGPDKTATIESILNLLQETALNHVWMSGLLGDGFGATHGMMKNNLIWVVSRMQLQVDHYPIWGEIMEIDTWVGASGKNGMRRDWQLRSRATGIVFARATSTWVMMDKQTRRLSKMPDEVRAELSPWFIDNEAIQEESLEKIAKLDDNATYMNSDMKPKRSDLDMNHHVNNVKYVKWMVETIPDQFLEKHQLSSIILEYRRECGSTDLVQSLCEPEIEYQPGTNISSLLNEFSLDSGTPESHGLLELLHPGPVSYTHLLKIKGQSKNEEIVRGKTSWKRKICSIPFPT